MQEDNIFQLIEKNDIDTIHALFNSLQNSPDGINSLLNKKNSQPPHDTLLHHAALLGKPEIVSLLLKYKADVHAKNTRFETPLHRAAEGGNIECGQLLLKHNADIENPTTGFLGETALFYSTYFSREEFTKLLITHGANTTATNYEGKTPAQRAQDSLLLSPAQKSNISEFITDLENQYLKQELQESRRRESLYRDRNTNLQQSYAQLLLKFEEQKKQNTALITSLSTVRDQVVNLQAKVNNPFANVSPRKEENPPSYYSSSPGQPQTGYLPEPGQQKFYDTSQQPPQGQPYSTSNIANPLFSHGSFRPPQPSAYNTSQKPPQEPNSSTSNPPPYTSGTPGLGRGH